MELYEGPKKCERTIVDIEETGLKTNNSCRDVGVISLCVGVISLCNGKGIRRPPPLAINRALESVGRWRH